MGCTVVLQLARRLPRQGRSPKNSKYLRASDNQSKVANVQLLVSGLLFAPAPPQDAVRMPIITIPRSEARYVDRTARAWDQARLREQSPQEQCHRRHYGQR